MSARILVVEDEAIIARDIQSTLKALGYDVPKTAASCDQALAAVREFEPALVLMDINIQGDVDGIDTAARIRDLHGTPVIYLTSYSDETTVRRAKATGAYGYLLKPFSDRDLRTAIEVALQKRQLEDQLAERERWYVTTLKSIGDAVIATDLDQRITFMNAVAEKVTGFAASDAIGKELGTVFRLIDPGDGTPIESPLTRAFREGFAVELPRGIALSLGAGGTRAVDDSAAPIVDDRGKTLGGVIVFRDVTDRRQLEERLAHTERLAAIATLSAGMAHEINNPLAYVLSNVTFAIDGLKDLQDKMVGNGAPDLPTLAARLSDLEQALGDAHEGGNRVRRIIEDLKKFGKLDESEPALLELSEVIELAVQTSENTLRHRARVIREYRTTPFVQADHGNLGQVFVNLLLNAAQSLAGRDHQEIVVATYTDEAGRAVGEVRDSGAGIPIEIQRRIFDPFFTTKAVGEGAGLGLSVAHAIVRALGGEITVESHVGHGSTFRVALVPAQQQPRAKAVSVPSSRRARVLVIDDEPAIGRAMSRVLKREHDVFVVDDARDALPRIAAGEVFDVILCDLMMPEMTGMDFFSALASGNPDLSRRIVFVTGGAVTAAAQEFLRSTANPVLQKPVDPAALRRVVADYLEKNG